MVIVFQPMDKATERLADAHGGCFTETGEADGYDRATNRTMAIQTTDTVTAISNVQV